ncbi:VWA domain-containing protein, partial [Thiohalospira sp.]|uniref:VWA domain-containing protein n=1 Tax=Thiohalospira sp. TaxID=3080549 RepID=UPI003980B2C7
PPRRGGGARRRRLAAAALWLLVVLAAAQPVAIERTATAIEGTARNLVIGFDISVSMLTRDMGGGERGPTRLEVAQDHLRDFIARRQGDRLGLIVFGGRAYPLVPLTHDHAGLSAMLDGLDVGLAGTTTNIGATIALAADRTDAASGAQRVLLLLTDGAHTAPGIPMETALDRAEAKGLRIHTVGIGAGEEGAEPIDPMRDLDEPLLRRIAERTGGRYFPAADPQALAELLTAVDEREPIADDRRVVRAIPLYPLPLGLALLGSGLWVALNLRHRPAPAGATESEEERP